MRKVNQTILSDKNGNCLAAAWASLLELDIADVPNFVEAEDYHGALCDFLQQHNLEYYGYIVNGNRTDLTDEQKASYEFMGETLPEFGSIGGYYEATVYSPGYYKEGETPVCHAVVIDKHFNIVHDPNPNYAGTKQYPMADKLGRNGVLGVCLFVKKLNSELKVKGSVARKA